MHGRPRGEHVVRRARQNKKRGEWGSKKGVARGMDTTLYCALQFIAIDPLGNHNTGAI